MSWPNDDPVFACGVCGYRFVDEREIRMHSCAPWLLEKIKILEVRVQSLEQMIEKVIRGLERRP